MIAAPIHALMPPADYHADYAAVSNTMLKTFRSCRAEYEAVFVKRTREREDPSRKMDLGSLCHAVLLEPENVNDLFIEYPTKVLASDGSVREKAKNWAWAEKQSTGRTAVKRSDFERVKGMAESVEQTCADWIKMPSVKERPIYWTDEETGLRCRCKPDWLFRIMAGSRKAFVFDVKGTANASPQAFRRTAESLEYWIQDAHYTAGVKAATGCEEVEFIFVVVEDEWPHRCALYRFKPIDRASAEAARRQTLRDIKRCVETDNWKEAWEGPEVLNEIEVRPWVFND